MSLLFCLLTRGLYQLWLSSPKTSPGKHLHFFVDVLSLNCLQYKQSRCVCVLARCPRILSGHESTTRCCLCEFSDLHQRFHCSVGKGKGASHLPPPGPTLSVCLSSIVRSLLSVHKTDGVQLMGVFVALFASGGFSC